MYADWNHQYYRNDIKWNIRFGCLLFSSLKMQFTIFWFFFHNKMIRFCSKFVQGKLRATNSEYEPNSCALKFIKLNEFSAFFFKFNEQYLDSSECLLVSRGCTSMMMMIFFSCDMMYNDIQCRPKPILDLIRLHWICVCVWMFALVCIS